MVIFPPLLTYTYYVVEMIKYEAIVEAKPGILSILKKRLSVLFVSDMCTQKAKLNHAIKEKS